MAKCKDCLHYEACLTFSKIINAARDVEKGCEHFKDRTDVVEVVRCKDCDYCEQAFDDYWCKHPHQYGNQAGGEYIVRAKEYIEIWLKQPAEDGGDHNGC